MSHKLTVRLDDETWDELRPKLRPEMGCSASGFYEALTRMFLAGQLPDALMQQVGPLARQVDDERAARGSADG